MLAQFPREAFLLPNHTAYKGNHRNPKIEFIRNKPQVAPDLSGEGGLNSTFPLIGNPTCVFNLVLRDNSVHFIFHTQRFFLHRGTCSACFFQTHRPNSSLSRRRALWTSSKGPTYGSTFTTLRLKDPCCNTDGVRDAQTDQPPVLTAILTESGMRI